MLHTGNANHLGRQKLQILPPVGECTRRADVMGREKGAEEEGVGPAHADGSAASSCAHHALVIMCCPGHFAVTLSAGHPQPENHTNSKGTRAYSQQRQEYSLRRVSFAASGPGYGGGISSFEKHRPHTCLIRDRQKDGLSTAVMRHAQSTSCCRHSSGLFSPVPFNDELVTEQTWMWNWFRFHAPYSTSQ